MKPRSRYHRMTLSEPEVSDLLRLAQRNAGSRASSARYLRDLLRAAALLEPLTSLRCLTLEQVQALLTFLPNLDLGFDERVYGECIARGIDRLDVAALLDQRGRARAVATSKHHANKRRR